MILSTIGTGLREIKKLADLTDRQLERNWGPYGYRQMSLGLKSQNIHKNPKAVLRIMKKYDPLSGIRRRRKWIQLGQQVHQYENLLDRQFQADKVNTKWMTNNFLHPYNRVYCTCP